jgi:hypothetical protein
MEALMMLEANGHVLPECKETLIKWRERTYELIRTKARYSVEEMCQKNQEIGSVLDKIISIVSNPLK